uniref:Uncharacterized protein n=1 Tax=Hyaloperonospora arabidopsidis (strain Emoy2) TaxID=559515 RepID=M4B575_HYAAE
MHHRRPYANARSEHRELFNRPRSTGPSYLAQCDHLQIPRERHLVHCEPRLGRWHVLGLCGRQCTWRCGR